MTTIRVDRIRSSAVAALILAAAAVPLAAQQAGEAPVTWTNQITVTAYGNKLAEACNGCGNAGAESQQTLTAGDGYVEFVPSTSHDAFTVGFGTGPASTRVEDIEFALRFHGNSVVEVRENGNYVTDTPYRVGQRFRIAIEDGAVNYYKYEGGAAERIHHNPNPAALQYPVKVEASMLGKGTQVENVMVAAEGNAAGASRSITWTNITNAVLEGNKLIGRTEDQNSGATSVETLTGDGFIEFTADVTDKMRAVGLDNQNSSNTFQDIDFGIVLRQNGIAEVWQGGTYISDTPYTAGTRFRIAVEDGIVKYYKYVDGAMQQIQATDARVANFPLHVDAALYESQAAISDVVGTRTN